MNGNPQGALVNVRCRDILQDDKWYLLISYYYSKLPAVHLLPYLVSKDVISAKSSFVSGFGIPDEIISDR